MVSAMMFNDTPCSLRVPQLCVLAVLVFCALFERKNPWVKARNGIMQTLSLHMTNVFSKRLYAIEQQVSEQLEMKVRPAIA